MKQEQTHFFLVTENMEFSYEKFCKLVYEKCYKTTSPCYNKVFKNYIHSTNTSPLVGSLFIFLFPENSKNRKQKFPGNLPDSFSEFQTCTL